MKNSIYFLVVLFAVLHASCGMAQTKKNKYPDPKTATSKTVYSMKLSDDEWKKRLSTEQYRILRQEGTEKAGTGKYDHFYENGTYYSAASLQPVFNSEAKFNSGTGWPSFYAPVNPDAVYLVKDESFGMVRWAVVDSKS